MAKSKSTARVRSSENSASRQGAHEQDYEPNALQALTHAIDCERTRLMEAEAILHCASIALEQQPNGSSDAPHYQTAIDLARTLIAESINQLDLVRLKAIMGRGHVRSELEVKEPAYLYMQ